MAKRYGGKYSPNGVAAPTPESSFRHASPTRAGGMVNFLFIAPLPLIWRAFTSGSAQSLALYLVALAGLLLAAWMTREGLLAEDAYHARKIARRPGFPRKFAGSILTGLGLGIAGYASEGGLVVPLIYAIIGAGLHSFAFGLDPMRNKGMEGIDQHQTDRVARAIDKAEEHLRAMKDAVIRAGDRKVEARVDRFQETVREMLRTVEDDPRDLTSAKKYMGVYLMGARDASVKYADIYSHSRDAKARSDYMMLLTDLEENFAAKTRAMLKDDNTDLEIEIEVLRDRLQRDGIHLNKSLT